MDQLVEDIKKNLIDDISTDSKAIEKVDDIDSHLNWVSDRRALQERFLGFGILHHIPTWNEYKEHLNVIWTGKDIGRLALTIYDSPQN